MSWKKRTSFLRTTTFRLTLWYLGLYGIVSLLVFGLVYGSLTSHLHALMDHEIRDKAREFMTLYEHRGLKALRAEFVREAESQGTGDVFFALTTADGKLLTSSDLHQWKIAENYFRHRKISTEEMASFATLPMPGHNHKVRVITMSAGDGNVIQIGNTLAREEDLLEDYRETFGAALVIMLVCGGLVGWLLARKAMSGVKRVTETATHIGVHDFGRRVALANEGSEICALVVAFNGMLERVESLLHELQRITDNVAHELRTPLTRIRGIAETTMQGGRDLDDFREMAAAVIDSSDDLIEMVSTMLDIAKADSGVAEFAANPVDMRDIVTEAADLFAPAAEDRGLDIQLVKPGRPVLVVGDRPRLQRVVANLLDNAIKYTSTGGTVTLSVTENSAGIKVDVVDTGMGIDAKDLSRIFDRFFRGDQSRSSAGSGLGLSLAQAIIRAHGGDITVTSSSAGSIFSILLPHPPSPTR